MINPFSTSNAWAVAYNSSILAINVHGTGSDYTDPRVRNTYNIRPVLYLSSSIKLKGQGTESQPYQILNS